MIILLMQDKPTGESFVCVDFWDLKDKSRGPSLLLVSRVGQRMRENAYTRQRTIAGLGLVASRLAARVNLARSLASAYARTCTRRNGA